MSAPCPHAAGGCDYPASECAGHCASKQQPEPLLLADWLSMGPLWQHKNSAASLRRLYAENAELKSRLGHATERALVHKERADKMQAQLDAANKACNDLAVHVDDLLKQRDHWHSRLLAEVNKRNKTGETA